MILELHLRNLGLIADVSVSLGPGLNVVTGETGVGKTLLVTSVSLLAGGRATSRLVGASSPETVVEALVAAPSLNGRLSELGLDAADENVWARRLGADGRSRAWIGGRLVGVSTLAELGEHLVEIHGQGTGFALAKPQAQTQALDALARNASLLDEFRRALAVLRALERDRASIESDERTRAREIDLLRYQSDEIERAKLEPGEDDKVAADLARLEHAERLGAIGREVVALTGADGAAATLATAQKSMEAAAVIDPSARDIAERLGVAAVEAAELARDARAWTETTEADPRTLEQLRERRALLGSLRRKYGPTVEAVIDFGHQSRERLTELETSEERLASIEAEIARARNDVDEASAKLSKARRRAAKTMTKLVAAELPALALPQATFEIVCEPAEELTENGGDAIEFRFSSTSKRAPEPIGKVASGGELSRAMIAVTLALAQSHSVPVLLFDEADQGVAGEAALELARRLARVGRTHQVLVVSHLPQIAAFADRHIAVRRRGDDIEVEPLDDDARLAEISRMLAGLESSDLARAHATELVQLAREERKPVRARAG